MADTITMLTGAPPEVTRVIAAQSLAGARGLLTPEEMTARFWSEVTAFTALDTDPAERTIEWYRTA